MQYVIEYEVAALIFDLLLFIYATLCYPINSKKNFMFRVIAVDVMLTTLIDIVTAIMINKSIYISDAVNLWANTFYFAGGTFLAYMYSYYIDEYLLPENGKKLFSKTKIIAIVLLELNIILNTKTKLLFYFDENKQYVHGKLYYGIYAGIIFFIIMVAISILGNFKVMTRAQRVFGICIIFLFISPTVVQMVWMQDTLLMMYGASLTMLLNFFLLENPDYVKLKDALEETQQARLEADMANNAKGHFLAHMSHEIRTPINAVLGMNTMILRKSKDPEIREYADNIQSAGRNLLSIINDILDFSKIESGKMELVDVDYDFSSLVNDVYNMINTKATDKDLEFVLEIDETIPCRLHGDDVRIKQIIVNLLTNAVKYTPAGKVCLSISRKDNNSEKEAVLHFAVKDTGIGIKSEDISLLTEEFVRIEESRNRNIEGTGLGINIVGSLLTQMGSKLEIDSVYGEGSTFYFDLVQPIIDAEEIGNIRERLNGKSIDEGYYADFCIPDARLLVVDDNPMNLSVFSNLLSDMECQIDEADSGAKCLKLVKENKYDIVFMDHMMPKMDGVETLHHMQEYGEYINFSTPVVILTANAMSGAEETYLSEGFTDYLSKPIDVEKLERMIERLIPEEKKKPVEERKQAEEASVELPFIDGVDWKHAMSRLNSETVLLDSINSLSDIAQADIKELTELLATINETKEQAVFDKYRIKVHSMKTNVATIGADHLAGLAKYLEYAAKDYNLDTINNLMPLFETEWCKLKSELDKAFKFDQKGVATGDESNDTLMADDTDLHVEKHRILAIDDNPMVLRGLKQILDTEYDITLAKTVDIAKKLVESKNFELILLDYEMPETDGIEAYNYFVENPSTKGIPIVFLTGVSDKERILEVESLEPKPAGYLLKPVDVEILKTTINKVLG